MSDEANATVVPVTPDLPGSSSEEGKLNLSSKAAIFEPSEKESKEQEPTEKAFATPVDSKAENHLSDETPTEKGALVDSAALGLQFEEKTAVAAVTQHPVTPAASSNKVDRVLALDRPVEVSSDLDDYSPPSDNRRDEHDEDEGQDVDSSDDESSYFAKNLPDPKSSKRYSFSSNASNASAPARTELHQNDSNRETDASLSFSDESDAEDAHHHSDSGVFQTQTRGAVADLHTYPDHITRMHSVSSLVSTSSQNSSASEQSAGDELRAAAKNPQSGGGRTKNGLPSGRRSPILGEHPPSQPQIVYSNQSSMNLEPSPPPIQPGYPYEAGLPHPQAHFMPHEQWAAWAASGGATAMQQQMQQPPMYPYAGYGRPALDTRAASARSSNSAWSSDTLAYSEDGEVIQQSGNPRPPQSQGPRYPPTAAGQQQQQPKRYGREEELGTDGSALEEEARSNAHTSKERELALASSGGGGDPGPDSDDKEFKVYWQRWIMLMYMSMLNLLSDWTCYSVAPIALMTEEAFGGINPEQLVVVFLCANGMGTACEPIILSRLGLRRTVLFGSLLLMIGSIIKSGGMPPIIQANLEKGEGEWRVYLGFFLVGLSQPLYQCTPALLSASWFPERERTLATGVALNSNQLGIGCAFIFGTLLVKTSDDIPGYFGLLSIISTLTFLGTLIQFDDAPPTPPSDTARVMRGTFEGRLPSLRTVFEYVGVGTPKRDVELDRNTSRKRDVKAERSTGTKEGKTSKRSSGGTSRRESSGRRSSRSSNRKSPRPSSSANTDESTASSNTRRRAARSQNSSPTTGLKGSFHGLAPAPSPARWGPVLETEPGTHPGMHAFPAPSPMMPGATGDGSEGRPPSEAEEQPPQQGPAYGQLPQQGASYGQPPQQGAPYGQPPQQGPPYGYHQPFSYEGHGYMMQQPGGQYVQPETHYRMGPTQEQAGQPMPPGMSYGPGAGAPPYGFPYQGPPQYPYPYWDPQFQHMAYHQQQQEAGYYQPPLDPHYYSYQQAQPQPYPGTYQYPRAVLPFSEAIDEGAEPVLTMTPHHLEIAIRDDQIWLSTRACLARPGFIHALVSFTVSGIVINTLSTFMDYLVRLNGAGREYTGIVGGSFQVAIMVSSLIVGQFTDKTRAYYSVTVGMLVLGAFGLAECGVNLDEDRGDDLRWSLVVVAILVGPLQPVSTELGVDVVYPLSENTVLVIQQLFSNMLSALFIPCFKAMKDVGRIGADETTAERPAYTFSFYLLIILHAAATVFFATFNGRYLRYEHEQEKKAQEEQRKAAVAAAAFQPVRRGPGPGHVYYPGAPDGRLDTYRTEQQPLLHPIN